MSGTMNQSIHPLQALFEAVPTQSFDRQSFVAAMRKQLTFRGANPDALGRWFDRIDAGAHRYNCFV